MKHISRLLSPTMAVVLLAVSAATAEAQSIPIPDRVTWEEAILAYEEGNYSEALVLLKEVIDAVGPVPAVLYDAAQIAFAAREYLQAEEYIMAALESADTEFKQTPDYNDAFRFAARVQRTLRPLRESLTQSTALPFADTLARPGFARPMKDRNSACEWKFDRGGLIGKAKASTRCANGQASSSGRVRIEMTVEKRSGGSRATAGILFGQEDAGRYYLLRVHPGWDEVGDMSLVYVEHGSETLLNSAIVYDSRNRPLRRWSDKGPWRIAVEIRRRRVDWFLNGEHVGTAYADSEIRGDIMAAAGGADGGEFLFTDLAIDRISLTETAGK